MQTTSYQLPQFNLAQQAKDVACCIKQLQSMFNNWVVLTHATTLKWSTACTQVSVLHRKTSVQPAMFNNSVVLRQWSAAMEDLLTISTNIQANVAMTSNNASKLDQAIKTFKAFKVALQIVSQRKQIEKPGIVCHHAFVEQIERKEEYNPHTDEHHFDTWCKICGAHLNYI